ncbi:MAG TPA: SDR family oxidoreductase, partial [Candidatus Hydrogenedentes bacterium]|nr:SDR family oxidoreductase [Candidatus Hydrogenedentota bacterium]
HLVERAVDLAGPVDILINSASAFPNDTLDNLTAEDLIRSIQVHAWAPLVLARRFVAQERAAAIVNLLDTRVIDYDRDHVSYHLGKRTLHALTSMMALEWAPRVRVNAIAPGLILPPEGKNEAYLEQLAHTNPLEAYGSPAAIASALLYLLRSDFVTGQVLFVDGGRHLEARVYD